MDLSRYDPIPADSIISCRRHIYRLCLSSYIFYLSFRIQPFQVLRCFRPHKAAYTLEIGTCHQLVFCKIRFQPHIYLYIRQFTGVPAVPEDFSVSRCPPRPFSARSARNLIPFNLTFSFFRSVSLVIPFFHFSVWGRNNRYHPGVLAALPIIPRPSHEKARRAPPTHQFQSASCVSVFFGGFRRFLLFH